MQDLLVEKSYDWKTQSFHDCVRYNLGYLGSFHELSSSPSQVQVADQFRANLNFSSLFFLSAKMMHQGYKNAHF